MINIKEEKLRAAIQIILGSEGIHNGKLEEDLVYGIKALSICEVGFSLPREEEAISEMERSYLMENSLPNPIQKQGYAIGFRNGYRWFRDNLKPVAN